MIPFVEPAHDAVRCRCDMDLEDGIQRCASRATQEDGLCDDCRDDGCTMARRQVLTDALDTVVMETGWVHMRSWDKP